MYKTRLEGRRYGRLTVIGLEDVSVSPKGKKYYRYRCVCDCGTVCVVPGSCLVNGNTQSCGCIRKEKSRERLLANKAEYERRRKERIEARRETNRNMFNEREFTKDSIVRVNGEVCHIKIQRKDSVEVWSDDKKRHYYLVESRLGEIEAIPLTWGGLYENGFREAGDLLTRTYGKGEAAFNVYTREFYAKGPDGTAKCKVVEYLHQVQEVLNFCGLKEEAVAIKA